MKNYILSSIGVALIVLLTLTISSTSKKSMSLSGSINFPAITAMSTSTSRTVTTSSTQILATTTYSNNYCSQYIEIVNDSPRTVYLGLNGGAPAVYNSGVMLSASSTYRMIADDGNLYLGNIQGISSGNANVTVQCF